MGKPHRYGLIPRCTGYWNLSTLYMTAYFGRFPSVTTVCVTSCVQPRVENIEAVTIRIRKFNLSKASYEEQVKALGAI